MNGYLSVSRISTSAQKQAYWIKAPREVIVEDVFDEHECVYG